MCGVAPGVLIAPLDHQKGIALTDMIFSSKTK